MLTGGIKRPSFRFERLVISRVHLAGGAELLSCLEGLRELQQARAEEEPNSTSLESSCTACSKYLAAFA
jgi:hypothetical protein